MASNFTVTIKGTPVLNPSRLLDLGRNFAELPYVDRIGTITINGPEYLYFAAWDQKYADYSEIEKVLTILARRYPDLIIELLDEWDGRDEDEPGAQGTRWAQGRLSEYGMTEMVWKEAR